MSGLRGASQRPATSNRSESPLWNRVEDGPSAISSGTTSPGWSGCELRKVCSGWFGMDAAASSSRKDGSLPACRHPVTAEAVRALEGHVSGAAPLLHTDEETDIIGAFHGDPQAEAHRSGELEIVLDVEGERGGGVPDVECDTTLRLGCHFAECAFGSEIQIAPLGAGQRPFLLGAYLGDDIPAFPHFEPDRRRFRDIESLEIPIEEVKLRLPCRVAIERRPFAAPVDVRELVRGTHSLKGAE